MAVTCGHSSTLSSLAENVAGEGTTLGTTKLLVDQLLSVMIHCATSDLVERAYRLSRGTRRKSLVQMDWMLKICPDRQPDGEGAMATSASLCSLLLDAVRISAQCTIEWYALPL
jgi:hypothetical protein